MQTYANSQNKITKILVDNLTKNPLNSATINNEKDYTISNTEGYFMFISELDSIKIRMLGYEKIKTTFKKLMNSSDTIYLKQKTYKLQEVLILNNETLLSKVYKKLEKNYPFHTYSEKFFLRCMLKKNDKIIKLEDLYGKLQRNSMFKTRNIKDFNFDVELLNLRKNGLLDKSKKVADFEFLSFEDLLKWFSTIFKNHKQYQFNIEKTNDSNFVKLAFNPRKEFVDNSAGYYIINLKDYSIKEFFSQSNPEFPKKNIPFTKKRNTKWRTIHSDIHIYFDRNKETELYYISNVDIKQNTELFEGEMKNNFTTEYNFITTKSFIDNDIKSNVSMKKDVFKLKHKYSKDFWKNQNQLVLTKEMQQFLDNLGEKENQFLIFSNMNDK
jgi:hypothetical protein